MSSTLLPMSRWIWELGSCWSHPALPPQEYTLGGLGERDLKHDHLWSLLQEGHLKAT